MSAPATPLSPAGWFYRYTCDMATYENLVLGTLGDITVAANFAFENVLGTYVHIYIHTRHTLRHTLKQLRALFA